MESHTEIVLEGDGARESDPVATEIPVARTLPFSFAKRHGVLIRELDGGVDEVVYRSGAAPLSLVEARRFAGVPLTLPPVPTSAFQGCAQVATEAGRTMAVHG